MPTERPSLVGRVSANFLQIECRVVSYGQRHRSLRPYSRFSRPITITIAKDKIQRSKTFSDFVVFFTVFSVSGLRSV
jgi:hypothetical protein